jgi:hypothetical protein
MESINNSNSGDGIAKTSVSNVQDSMAHLIISPPNTSVNVEDESQNNNENN